MPVFGKQEVSIQLIEPNFQVAEIKIRGSAPLVMNKWSNKAKEELLGIRQEGSTNKSRKKREPKDFDKAWKDAAHLSSEGWYGMPASAFRDAMITACKVSGFVMTRAKLSIFILPDGFDGDNTPLVKITKGEPRRFDAMVRLKTGVPDVRSRPMWAPGWEASVKVRFDADQLRLKDVFNLLYRAGYQVGVFEGRPDSKDSNGQGWGLFDVVTEMPKEEVK